MAVRSCKRRHNSRRGPSYRKDGSRVYRDTWTVEVDSPTNDGHVVLGAAGLPRFGEGFPDDSLAVVTDLDPWQSAESELVWYVEVVYTWEPPQPPGSGQPQPPPGQPTEEWWRPQRFWTAVEYQTFPLHDLDGRAFKNSAGDPFEHPPETIERHRVLTVKQRRQMHDEFLIGQFMDQPTINNDPFIADHRNWPAFSALIRKWDMEQAWYTGQDGQQVEYWNRTVEIEFNRKLWHPVKVLDLGRRCKITGKAGVHITRDDNGVATGHLALLDGKGLQLPPSWESPPVEPGQVAIGEIGFRCYVLKSFATLMLDLEIPQDL